MTKSPARGQSPRNLLQIFWQLLLPVSCLVCSQEGEWICSDCRSKLVVTPAVVCAICSKGGQNGICQLCQDKTGLDGIICLHPYRQVAIKKLIKGIKFAGYTDAVKFFTTEYSRPISKRLPIQDYHLCAIPLSKKRLATRGFNQAEVLLKELAANLDMEIWDGLMRVKQTAAQAELPKKDRAKNVRGAFRLVRGTPIPSHVVLVDDVITTGATLSEAAKIIRRGGALSVWALTIAHG